MLQSSGAFGFSLCFFFSGESYLSNLLLEIWVSLDIVGKLQKLWDQRKRSRPGQQGSPSGSELRAASLPTGTTSEGRLSGAEYLLLSRVAGIGLYSNISLYHEIQAHGQNFMTVALLLSRIHSNSLKTSHCVHARIMLLFDNAVQSLSRLRSAQDLHSLVQI